MCPVLFKPDGRMPRGRPRSSLLIHRSGVELSQSNPTMKNLKNHKKKKPVRKTVNHVKFQRGPQFSKQALGLPSSKVVQMRYCETFGLVSTVGALGSYEWSANDLYDPNITGGGHQPYGFDQWSVFYTKFTVLKSQMHAIVASNGAPMIIGVTFARTAAPSTITSAVSLIESGRGTGTLVSGSSAPVKTVRTNWDIKITDPEYDPGSFFCTSSASPTFRYHYSLFAQTTDGATTATALGYVTIDYDVLLEDPITLASS